ncbi:unnamed protein product [Thlaspi arvense]|uniref:Uncharacterized protein n=1 Tax=Thlaspi arvense TaxID=13288 RepID=A0AAU9RFV5_THLAR|nr:unnamed protein product [Thlaspi arvense]
MTLALDVKPPDCWLRLTFSVNARPKLINKASLRDGVYGNALCVACALTTVSELVDGRLLDATRPSRLEFDAKLSITQWTRFSIYEFADFVGGRPVSLRGPIDLTPTPQICIFLPEGDQTTSCGVDVGLH